MRKPSAIVDARLTPKYNHHKHFPVFPPPQHLPTGFSDNRYICFPFAYTLTEVTNVVNDTANAYAFGSLLRQNSKADAAYENSTPQQRQSILLKVAAANPGDLPKIVSSLENSAH